LNSHDDVVAGGATNIGHAEVEGAQSLHAEPARQAEDECRRLGGPVHPARLTGGRQGGQLASGAGRPS